MKSLIICALLLITNTAAYANPSISEKTDYYRVSGWTPSMMRASMNASGPMDGNTHVDAKTTWYITWHYDFKSSNPCILSNIQVSASIVRIWPQWDVDRIEAPSIHAQWDKYLANLNSHENGHAENAKNAATEIEKALWEMPNMSTCDALSTAANNKANQIIKQHNDWDTQYDIDTRHGATQGAVFP